MTAAFAWSLALAAGVVVASVVPLGAARSQANFQIEDLAAPRAMFERLPEWGRGKRGGAAPALFEALDHAREARQWAETPVNKPLALERILWRLATLAAAARR